MAENPRLPNFIAAGPQRTGTTWLHKALQGHAALPRGTKETDFFLKNYSRGIGWYLEFFRGYPPELPVGEIDPNYFGSDDALKRIAEHVPRAKIICSFRDPVERAYSSYRTMRRDAWTRIGFEETIAKNRMVKESSRYAHYLRKWQERFGADRVLVCLYDDLAASPQAYLDRVCDFIGVPRIAIAGRPLATERVNTVTHAPRSRRLAQNARNARDWMLLNRWRRTNDLLERTGVWRFCFGRGEEFPPLDPETDARLRRQYLPEVEALEKLIGRDLSAWKPPAPARERIAG
ncbi:MAG: sulfotransferase family protein [Candidatus Binataceae bacterium]